MKKPSVNIIRNPKSPQKESDRNPDRRRLVLRVSYDRSTRYFTTGSKTKLTADEFQKKNLKKYKTAYEEVLPAYNAALEIIKKLGDDFNFESFAKDYKRIVHQKYTSAYDVRMIFAEYLSDPSKALSLSDRTKSAYNTTLNWLTRFKENLTIEEITSDMISKLDMFMRTLRPEISQNTINAYFRSIKAVYNYAVEKGYVDDSRPFRKYPLTSTRRVNFGLSLKSIQQILAYNSPDNKAQFGRDLFVLSFELNGHYLSDILRFKNKNLTKSEEGWTLQFIRQKTKRHAIPVSLYVTDEAMNIIERYGCVNLSRPNDYIFPFLHNAKTERQINDRINDINYRANEGLRIVTEELGLPHTTMAQARHTYASLQCEFGRSLMDIQMDMGHTNSTTTQGYINSLRTSAMKRSKAIKEQIQKGIVQII
jgi:integrase